MAGDVNTPHSVRRRYRTALADIVEVDLREVAECSILTWQREPHAAIRVRPARR